jgi:5-carboxymethyl-2-hydroxymuconate isomerase
MRSRAAESQGLLMPHALIEYSGNIEEDFLCAGVVDRIHGELMECGLFEPQDIKTRSYSTSDFMVGEKGQDGSFIHATIYLLEGRTLEQKQDLSQRILDALQCVENVDSVTVDVRELVKDVYRKRR